ncbi:alpha/beta hydrolase [Kibdelosporangium lantanae]
MPTLTSVDGTLIGYTAVGSGPTVLHVGGALMHRAIDECGAGMAAELSDGYTVVTYDRRGRGESGDTPPYTVQREIADITALVTEFGDTAMVFGESSGAVLALEAVLAGAPVSRLALYEPPFTPLPPGFIDRLDALVVAGRPDDVLELFMTVAAGLPAAAVEEARASPIWPVLRRVAHTIVHDGRVMGDTQSGDPGALRRFARVTVPTLVLAGSVSPQPQREAVRRLAAVVPDARTQVVDGQGHQFDPAVVAPVVRRFFSEPV